MRSMSGRELARLVERHGWTLLRVNGSHHIYGKPGSVVRLSIPIHANKPLKTGLLRHLVKMADVPEAEIQ
ncbi:MAG TPA: type II toxin-antitoxin system HicA family toxin [Xanthobacteraceae bacterium]|nr:type II toxin-antitoxin system HicA family toxin [Xanthobacteraceae bacterium]